MSRAVLIVLLPCVAGALAQPLRDAQSDAAFLQWWVAAAVNHKPGEADEPAIAVGDLSRAQLLRILQRVEHAPSPGRAIRLGAVLHLDIAFRVSARARGALFSSYPRTGPPPPPVPFFVVDGAGTGLGLSSTHLELARALIRKLTPAVREAFARAWYVGSAAELARRKNFAELAVHLEHARDIVPGDAEILLASGYLHECFAGPMAQAAARERASIRVGERSTNLRQAERYFREALEEDPVLAEARLRLGRVLGLQNRHKDAIPELQRALDLAKDRMQSYYALLLLGREEESLGRLEAAREHFEHASAMYPTAQSPRLALSRLAVERGNDDEAQRTLDGVIDAPPEAATTIDPWWIYDFGPGRYADSKLSELYQVLKEEAR